MSLRNAIYINAEHTAAGVGDVTSEARGSGARYNTGKAPVELIPIWVLAEYFDPIEPDNDPAFTEARRLLFSLGNWQRGIGPASQMFGGFFGDWWTDCALVFDYGRKKYAEWNWAKGMAWSIPLACAVRHLLAILRGEENDPESGLPHRGHVACNLVMLAQYEATYHEGDDRPTKWLTPQKAA